MNRRRAMIVFAIAMSPLVAIVASCSFPDLPRFVPDQEAGTSDAPNQETSSTDSAGDAAPDNTVVGANEDVDPDGGSHEASTREGGAMIDAAGCTCDCDNDKFQKSGGGCDGGPGPMPDCDDLDDLIYPDAGFVAAQWTSNHMPPDDWNCDGTRTRQYSYDRPCTDPNNCVSGFAGNPNCGETATFNICKYTPGIAGILASCKVDTTAQVTQGCK